MEELKITNSVPPKEFLERYTILKKLGRGTYAVVYLAENNKTKDLKALKVINKEKVMKKEHLEAEIETLRKASHPNIIELHEVFETEKFLYLLTEYAEGGELYEKLVNDGVYSELEAAGIMKKLLEAVHYLHMVSNVIHRDLKPENILLCKSKENPDILIPKLNDFGIAKLFDGNVSDTKKEKKKTNDIFKGWE